MVMAAAKKSAVSTTGIKCADCPAEHSYLAPTDTERSALGTLVASAVELLRLWGKRWSFEKGAWRCWDCTRRRRLVRSA